MTILANYGPNLRLIFTILNLLTSNLILLYTYCCYFNGIPFHKALTFSTGKKRFLNGRIFANIGPYKD